MNNQLCCTPTGYDCAILIPDKNPEKKHDRCVDQDIPSVHGRHRTKTDCCKDAGHPACGTGEHTPSPVCVHKDKDKEDLVENSDNVRMDIPPNKGKKRKFINGISECPGYFPT